MAASGNSSPAPFSFGGNINHVLPIRLANTNYLLWRAQFLPLFRLHGFMGYVDGTFPCPPKEASTTSSLTETTNSAYIKWHNQDQTILCCLLSTLTEPVFSLVVGLDTSVAVWSTLEKHFASHSQARIMHLEFQLRSLKKGDSSLAEYVQKVKTLADHLAAVAKPVPEYQLVLSLLSGLGSEYDSFVTSVTSRLDPLSLDDFLGILYNHEALLQSRVPTIPSVNLSVKSTPDVSGYVRRSRGRGRGRGRGRFTADSFDQRPKVLCQVCNRTGHSALQCYQRFNPSFHGPPTPSVHYAQHSSSGLQPMDTTWYPDSGATHHFTSDMGNISHPVLYSGSDTMRKALV